MTIEEKAKEELPKFDIEISPVHPNNQRAAMACGLIYDHEIRGYVDRKDRYLVLDKSGNPI